VSVTAQPLFAFDANGVTNCSGAPKTCAPLWTTTVGANVLPAIAGGVAYAGDSNGTLYAFDATGRTNCGGIPNVCVPLSTTTVPGTAAGSSPTIANGTIYTGSFSLKLYAFKPTTH
jgi:outer membrane protein assembly factor BamB